MKKISLFFAAAYILIALSLYISFQLGYISKGLFHSVLISELINFFNLLLALVAFKFSVNKSNQEFVFYNLGGLVARMFILLLTILVILKFLNIDQDGFILSFFIFYFSQLAAEIGYFGSYKKIKAE